MGSSKFRSFARRVEVDVEVDLEVDFEGAFGVGFEIEFEVDFEVDFGIKSGQISRSIWEGTLRIRLRSAYNPLTIRLRSGTALGA